MNKIENRILENQKTIILVLSEFALELKLGALEKMLERKIKETNKLLESEGRSF